MLNDYNKRSSAQGNYGCDVPGVWVDYLHGEGLPIPVAVLAQQFSNKKKHFLKKKKALFEEKKALFVGLSVIYSGLKSSLVSMTFL